MTDLLNIVFDKFDIRLPGYRIEFSCLYTCIPKNYFMFHVFEKADLKVFYHYKLQKNLWT